MEQTWKVSSDTGSPIVPPLRVYMRLGALYNTLGRTGEAKVKRRRYFSTISVLHKIISTAFSIAARRLLLPPHATSVQTSEQRLECYLLRGNIAPCIDNESVP